MRIRYTIKEAQIVTHGPDGTVITFDNKDNIIPIIKKMIELGIGDDKNLMKEASTSNKFKDLTGLGILYDGHYSKGKGLYICTVRVMKHAIPSSYNVITDEFFLNNNIRFKDYTP